MPKVCQFLSILLILFSCTTAENRVGKKILAVSILPQKYFVEKIAGSTYDVLVMIPPGASPATYEPTPYQIKQLQHVPLYFSNGYIGFEKSWLNKIAATNADMQIWDLSEGVSLIAAEDSSHTGHIHTGGIDPHYWMSPEEVKKLAENIMLGLSRINPERGDFYAGNYVRFLEEIDSLAKDIEQKIRKFEGKSFIIFHPALSYFARDYGLVQLSVEWEGKSPTLAHFKNVIDQARKENLKTVLVQRQFETDNAQAVAEELGGEVVVIDPLAEDWTGSIQMITDTLVSIFSTK